MVVMIDEALGKRRCYGEPSTRAPTLERACFVKNGYRLLAVANMSTIFNKLPMFVLCYWKISLTF